jgi:hypothetical protein
VYDARVGATYKFPKYVERSVKISYTSVQYQISYKITELMGFRTSSIVRNLNN